ncbi:hypothetical protein JXB31_04725 [Candidatus Woesearchaeota archaeon]|nr:hypothetical protein [Candidatus Woesearchaeota archaeon]
MDFILAMFIFSVCIMIYYKTLPNVKLKSENPVDEAYLDAKAIASSVVSLGSPLNWTNDSVQRIGIVDYGNEISERKVTEFKSMASSDYYRTKTMLGVTSDFIVYFIDNEQAFLDINNTGVIGFPTVAESAAPDYTNVTEVGCRNLVRIERIMLYNNSPAKMVIFTWN